MIPPSACTYRRGVLTLVLAMMMAACGSDGDESSAGQGSGLAAESTTADGDLEVSGGCAVVSVEEVATITGEEVTGTTEMGTGCQWALSADGAWYDWQGFPSEVYEQNRDAASFEIEPVAGLGTEAFMRVQVTGDGSVTNGETWVLLGATALHVRTAGLVWTDDVGSAQQSLAELIAGRL